MAATRRTSDALVSERSLSLTPDDYVRARRLLMRRDPVLGAVIKKVGPCGLAESQRADPFSALVEAIVWQQLSWKAANTIYSRVLAAFPPELSNGNGVEYGRGVGCPPPGAWLAMPEERLRAAGLSRQKTRYLLDLCGHVQDGSLPLVALGDLDDDEVIRALTAVKGIGRWTAEMFLMFRLHRPDVFPIGDLGIVRAIERLYNLRRPAKPARMIKIADAWCPYRSVASWYLWASTDGGGV
jgi:DNA-3-methyladenine glycosylase II